MVSALLRRFGKEPLAHTTIALYELPMQYPSVRWQQHRPAPPAAGADDPAARAQADAWLARTVILLIEEQVPLLTRELQSRVIGRLDEFVDYRVTWDKFAQQTAPRVEGGLLLAELDVRITPGNPPQLRANLSRKATGRSAYSVLATLLDGFASDTIRLMPPATQSWACLWLTYLIQWYTAGGPAALRGRASRHPAFYTPGGTPEAGEFPTGE